MGAGQGGYWGRVEFYDPRGNLTAGYTLGIEGPQRLLRDVAFRLTSCALLTGVLSLAGTSMLALGFMGLANNMVGDIATAAEVFTYAGLTAVLMLLVRQMAPYRPVGWLSGTHEQ